MNPIDPTLRNALVDVGKEVLLALIKQGLAPATPAQAGWPPVSPGQVPGGWPGQYLPGMPPSSGPFYAPPPFGLDPACSPWPMFGYPTYW